MKKIIALLLVLLTFAFSFALPVVSHESAIVHSEAAENPAMPVVVQQPQGGRVRSNTSHTLVVQAYIPNEDEIGFVWRETRSIHGTRTVGGSEHYLTRPAPHVFLVDYQYYVIIYNRSNPQYRVVSEVVTVWVYQTYLDHLRFNISLVLGGSSLISLNALIGSPVLLLIAIASPFTWLTERISVWRRFR